MNYVDLKKLILFIYDSKDINANLNLDSGCTVETDDQKPLVKVINYILNFLQQITDMPLEIGLELHSKESVLNLLAYTEKTDIPEPSPNIAEALKQYGAAYETQPKPGKYFQFTIRFKKSL